MRTEAEEGERGCSRGRDASAQVWDGKSPVWSVGFPGIGAGSPGVLPPTHLVRSLWNVQRPVSRRWGTMKSTWVSGLVLTAALWLGPCTSMDLQGFRVLKDVRLCSLCPVWQTP